MIAMDDVTDIKELVTQALTRQRVLSKLRAELRSHVFLTIEEDEKDTHGEGLSKKTVNAARESFISSPDGQVMVDLVHEFLQWCNMEFTLKVFEPELGLGSDYRTRSELVRQLGISDATPDGPLLLALLHARNGRGPASGTSAASGQPSSAPLLAAPTMKAPMTNEEESYSLDIEDDVELDAADIVEDEEDDASALASKSEDRGGEVAGSQREHSDEGSDGDTAGKRDDFVPEAAASPHIYRGDPSRPKPSSLAPIGARGQLAPLAPVSGAKALASLGAKKAMSDIKEELRREGLLTLPTDSFSASDNSMDFPTPTSVDQGGTAPLGPSRFSTNSRLQDLGMSVDVGQSLEMRDPAISPSDKSAASEIEKADLVETAEWDGHTQPMTCQSCDHMPKCITK